MAHMLKSHLFPPFSPHLWRLRACSRRSSSTARMTCQKTLRGWLMGAVWVLDTAAWVFKASEKKNKQTKEELAEKWRFITFFTRFFSNPFQGFWGSILVTFKIHLILEDRIEINLSTCEPNLCEDCLRGIRNAISMISRKNRMSSFVNCGLQVVGRESPSRPFWPFHDSFCYFISGFLAFDCKLQMKWWSFRW